VRYLNGVLKRVQGHGNNGGITFRRELSASLMHINERNTHLEVNQVEIMSYIGCIYEVYP